MNESDVAPQSIRTTVSHDAFLHLKFDIKLNSHQKRWLEPHCIWEPQHVPTNVSQQKPCKEIKAFLSTENASLKHPGSFKVTLTEMQIHREGKQEWIKTRLQTELS